MKKEELKIIIDIMIDVVNWQSIPEDCRLSEEEFKEQLLIKYITP